MGTFSLRELQSLSKKTSPMRFRQRRPPQWRRRSYFRHRKVRSWCERITPRSHFSTSRAPFCSVPPPECCCWLSVQIFQSLVTVKSGWSNVFGLPLSFALMLPSMLFSPSLPLSLLYCSAMKHRPIKVVCFNLVLHFLPFYWPSSLFLSLSHYLSCLCPSEVVRLWIMSVSDSPYLNHVQCHRISRSFRYEPLIFPWLL